MKHIPRAEISTIQDVLYPLRKKADPTWNRKNLEDIKEIKQKVIKLREEKQKELENKPEPFKLKQFRNIPSKFMDTKDWIIKKVIMKKKLNMVMGINIIILIQKVILIGIINFHIIGKTMLEIIKAVELEEII